MPDASEETMLKRLRIKFVALNMAIVAIVLLISFGAICFVSHQQSVSNVCNALQSQATLASEEFSSQYEGTNSVFFGFGFTRHGFVGIIGEDAQAINGSTDNLGLGTTDQGNSTSNSSTNESSDAPSQPQDSGSDTQRPEIGSARGSSDLVIASAVYVKTSDGTVSSIDQMTTASLSSDTLNSAIEQLESTDVTSGELSGLGLYYAKVSGRTATYYAFADTSAADSWQSLAFVLLGIGVLAVAVFLIISIFFSKWALKPVQQAWTQQQQFVADASHELKTPLTVILANMSILLTHPESSIASQSQWIEGTQEEATQMQDLVTDMLELARPSGTRRAMAHEPLNLSDMLEMEMLQFESVAFENHLNLESEIQPDITILGDEMRLRRLLSTLLDNACKYAQADGLVDVTLKKDGQVARLSVHNTGDAIAPEDLPHIFDRFYRADKARTRDSNSFGLGLAIAHDVAQDHGGSLTVASTPENGTTFTATLPIA